MSDVEHVIIGSGPAGLAAAAFGPTDALVIEARQSPGWKILISANGRCNVTNTFPPGEFLHRVMRGSRQLKTALGAFGPEDIRAWLADLGCPTVVQNGWEVYPKSNRAADVLQALLNTAAANGAQLLCDARVTSVKKTSGGFVIGTRHGEISCRRLLVAAGSPAWGRPQPQFDQSLGRLGHTLRPWVPGLCPIPLTDNPFDGLEGISFTGSMILEGKSGEADEILLTGDGLSGPAALNASARVFRRLYDGDGDDFALDLFPAQSRGGTLQWLLDSRRSHGPRAVPAILADAFPKRLAVRLAEISGAAEVPAAQLKRSDAERLSDLLHSFPCRVAGMPSLAKGFAASGGIPLEEVDTKTMQSKIVRGLFFGGEILDYDAPSGGFNITLALATGRLAGLSMASP